ncbi:hypothetical protein A2U01_0086433, partial [Trifolium medium]|nr:hypothetical protein [Trifolium medium]
EVQAAGRNTPTCPSTAPSEFRGCPLSDKIALGEH